MDETTLLRIQQCHKILELNPDLRDNFSVTSWGKLHHKESNKDFLPT